MFLSPGTSRITFLEQMTNEYHPDFEVQDPDYVGQHILRCGGSKT